MPAMQKSIVFVLALMTSVIVQAAPPSGEVCARTPSEVTASPLLKSAMSTFGRASDLFGSWKLGGLAAVFAKVTVTLRASDRAFSVQVDSSVPNNFWLCVDPSEPDVLRMRVQNPREADNSLFLIRAREIGKSLHVAAAKTKWKFMKFKRQS